MISPYLNVSQAAAYLQLSKSRLEGWRNVGKGPAYLKIGKRVVYDVADLDAFALSGRVVPPNNTGQPD